MEVKEAGKDDPDKEKREHVNRLRAVFGGGGNSGFKNAVASMKGAGFFFRLEANQAGALPHALRVFTIVDGKEEPVWFVDYKQSYMGGEMDALALGQAIQESFRGKTNKRMPKAGVMAYAQGARNLKLNLDGRALTMFKMFDEHYHRLEGRDMPLDGHFDIVSKILFAEMGMTNRGPREELKEKGD